MIPTRPLLAAALLALPLFSSGQTIEFGNLNVVQNDNGNTAASVTVTRGSGSSPNFSVVGGNRGDYDVSFGTSNDAANGVMISSVAENGRDNTAGGDTIGLFYASSASDFVNGSFANKYWVPVFRCANGDEVNVNVACAWFPYNKWLGGFVRNSSATNGGANNTLNASPGINLGTQFVDNGGGLSTVNLTGLGASSANGILLVAHGKNEDNYALSRANADGTFTVWIHDNGANGGTYEQDPVAFVYIPTSRVGSDQLVAMGRVNSDATKDVSGGACTVTKGGTGQWYLSIPGQSNTTGVLMISPEGGGTNTSDNVVSYEWDGTNNRWVIESRDLSGATVQPSLQNGATSGEDIFSFAFFQTPNNPPVASLTGPAQAVYTDPASFTVTADAADIDGTVAKVELLRNGVVVATDTDAPYTFDQTNLAVGSYSYAARATDDSGATGTSAAMMVTVNIDPANIPANTALRFDGVDDYVTMGVAPELGLGGPPSNGLTLECWFYKDGAGKTSNSGSGGVTGVPLFGKGRGESDGGTQDCDYFFGINSSGKLVADFESYQTGLNHPITAINAAIADGVWHHAAVTFDGNAGVWTMYLDGVEVGTATVSVAGAIPRYDSLQHFGIGAAFTTTGVAEGAFAGVMDEVRVWNYARSASEIAAGKDVEIGSAAGLVGRFGMNEGTGFASASSAGTTVGTLTNGPVWVGGAPFATPNTSPTITLTQPADGSTTYMPLPVTFAADAADADGTVAKMEFFVDGEKVGEDAAAPFSLDWTPPAIGDYAVKARAVDNLGAGKYSSAVTIHVAVNPNQAPVLGAITPADGATVTGSSMTLQVGLSDPESDAMTVTFYGRNSTPATSGPDFTLVALPDTQYYSEGSAAHANTVTVEELIGLYSKQTQWVIDNKAARNIAFVSHMGDVVDHGYIDVEYQRANAAMSILEDPVAAMRAYGIPYGVAPGNHDEEPNGNYDTGSTALFNQYFSSQRFAGRDYYGGHYGADNTNNYQLFSASGLDFIVIHLAYDTTQNTAILDWADALLKAYPQRRAIVTSHYLIGQGNPATFGAQGQAIYNRLRVNPNLFLMLCGHIHAEGRRADVYDGRTVYTVLSDYQGATNGGNGFLRVFTFSPANNKINVASYSPWLNRAVNATDSVPSWTAAYDLAYDMQTPLTDWVPLGTVNVPAGGSTAALEWTGLERGMNYEWYAAVTDGVSTVSTASNHFATSAGSAPTVSLDTPAAGASYLTPASIQLTATANDSDGTVARVDFYAGSTKIGEDATAPYALSWNGALPGSYSLSAVAVDDGGLTTFSNAVAVTVQLGDHLPTVAMTGPAAGLLLEAPAAVTLAANPQDDEGPVAKVEFYEDGETPALLGEADAAPYELQVTGIGAGGHSFFARVTDSAGQTADSGTVMVEVYAEAPLPNAATASAGTFDPPAWTVVKTGAAPLQFDQPGTNAGDLELRINGSSVPFSSGIALATNWSGPASTGNSSYDNIAQPYKNASGNLFVSVLDNSNNNAPGANPSTSEQTSGVSVGFLPYAGGWTGASVDSAGVVLSGNLPTGVRVANTGTGTYTIYGLSTAGNLLAFSNGDSGTLADNVVSVRVVNGRWVIDTRDNAGGLQNNEFSFLYVPVGSGGVYAGALSATGTITAPNAGLSALGGAAATVNSSYCEITFGDGAVINPSTAALFVVADSTNGAAGSAAVDNLIVWQASGNAFRIFTQDIPEINGTFEGIDLRFVAVPYAAPAPAVTTLAPTNVTPVSATLNGTVNPGGSPTTAAFEYGADASYGMTLPVALSPDNDGASRNVSANLAGLSAGQTCHYRLTASSAAGVMSGEDMSFVVPTAATVQFSAGSYEVMQGATSVELTITRSGFSTPFSVTIQTDNGTASAKPPFAAAVEGVDFTGLSGAETLLEFGEGENEKAVTVALIPKAGALNKRFSVGLGSPSGAVLGLTSSATVEILAKDAAEPTLTLTAPPAPTAANPVPLVSAAVPYLIKGIAGDAKGLDRVEVSLNGDPARAADIAPNASNTSQPYSLLVAPVEGSNTLVVTAYDLTGNASTITRSFEFTVRNTLSLTRVAPAAVPVDSAGLLTVLANPTKGASALTPATANASTKSTVVVPGTSIKVTATARTGYVFSHWSGTHAGAVETGNVVTFTMPAEDVSGLTASFVENPFLAPAGQGNVFYGLIRPESPATTATSNGTVGYLTGTLVPGGGTFSGRLVMDGGVKTFAATFYGNGGSLFTVAGEKMPTLDVNGKTLSLTFAEGDIHATVAVGADRSTGIAKRAKYSAAGKVDSSLLNQRVPASSAAPNKGYYTVGIAAKEQTPAADAATFPQGDGYMGLTLSENGTLTLSGVLADGSAVTGSSGLIAQDGAPVFAQLTTPGGPATIKGGSISGSLAFDTTLADTDVAGSDLLWIRPAVTPLSTPAAAAAATALYTGGWPNGIFVDAAGALYDKTLTVQAALGLPAATLNGNAQLDFTLGKLLSPITKSKFNIVDNKVTKIPANDASYTLTLIPTTGAFSGTFAPNWTDPNTAKPAFRGMLIQKGGNKGGFGFFLSNAKGDSDPESGSVTLGAQE